MPVSTATRRFLRSPLVDLLVGPHGVDRYLELIRPDLTVNDARAEVIAVRHQTARSVTLTLRPNAAFAGFTAGQFVRVGIEIDGIRRTRTYSPASAQHARGGLFELTATLHPGGVVSGYLANRIRPGTIVHLGRAGGEFVLPDPRPGRTLLVSGGSGITPVMAMLRTMCEDGHDGEVAFLHYGRTRADWLYRTEVQALGARHSNVRHAYIATREGGAHIGPGELARLLPGFSAANTTAAVCGPPKLIGALRDVYVDAPGRLLSETFTPPTLGLTGAAATDAAATGTLRFTRTGTAVPIATGTLLEHAESAGISAGVRLPHGDLPHVYVSQVGRRRSQRPDRRGLRRGGRGHPAVHLRPRRRRCP